MEGGIIIALSLDFSSFAIWKIPVGLLRELLDTLRLSWSSLRVSS